MNTQKFISLYKDKTSKELETIQQYLLDAVYSLISKEDDDPETAENIIKDLKLEIYYIQTLLYGTITIMFPHDFQKRIHPVIPGAAQWVYIKDGEVQISIVGGGSGLYGDGVRTFEMFDFREDEPQSYLLEDEINEHLKNNPFLNIAMTKQV